MLDPKQSFFSEQVRKKQSYFKEGKYKVNTAEFKRKISEKTNKISSLLQKLPAKSYVIFLVAFLLLLIYLLFITDIFIIRSVVLIEGEKISQNAGLNQLASRFLGRNIFLVDRTEVISRFSKFSANLSELKLDRNFPDELNIMISEIPILANLKVIVDQVTKNYTINKNGLIVGISEVNPKLSTITIEASSFPASTDPFIEADILTKILAAKNTFEQKIKLKITEVRYLSVARELHLVTEKGFVIWLDLGIDIEKQIKKLLDAENKLNFREINYQYFDLRISGATSDRIIFKK